MGASRNNEADREICVSTAHADEAVSYLSKSSEPVSIEQAARHVLSQDLRKRITARLYNPDETFRVGETLCFLTRGGTCTYAKVLEVHRYPDSDRITVEFVDEKWRGRFSCNPTDFVASCSDPELKTPYPNDVPRPGFVTETEWVQRHLPFFESQLRARMVTDDRFAVVDDECWACSRVIQFPKEVLDQVRVRLLPAPDGLGTGEMLELLGFPATQAYSWSLDFALGGDHRFVKERALHGGYVWNFAPPPPHAVVTVCAQDFRDGALHVTSGIRQMLDFYRVRGPSVLLRAHAVYEVPVVLDGDILLGPRLKEWFWENNIGPGDRVKVAAPEPGSPHLHIYPISRVHEPSEREREPSSMPSLLLRHRIHVLLKDAEEYMHYKVLAEQIARDAGIPVKPASVNACLNRSRHLFEPYVPGSGLWGLCGWSGRMDVRTNLLSLEFTLHRTEGDSVYKVLRDHRQPMTAEEIAKELAAIFAVRYEEVLRICPVDPNDERLLQLLDDTWILKEFVENARSRLEQLNAMLDRHIALSHAINEHRSALASVDEEIQVREQALTEIKKDLTAVSEQITSLDKKRDELELSGKQHSVAAESMKMQATELERQARTQFGRIVLYASICLASAVFTLYCGFFGKEWFWISLAVTAAAAGLAARQVRRARRLGKKASTRKRSADQASGRAEKAVREACNLEKKLEHLSRLSGGHTEKQNEMAESLEQLRIGKREVTEQGSAAEVEIERIDLPVMRQEKERIEQLLAKAPPC